MQEIPAEAQELNGEVGPVHGEVEVVNVDGEAQVNVDVEAEENVGGAQDNVVFENEEHTGHPRRLRKPPTLIMIMIEVMAVTIVRIMMTKLELI